MIRCYAHHIDCDMKSCPTFRLPIVDAENAELRARCQKAEDERDILVRKNAELRAQVGKVHLACSEIELEAYGTPYSERHETYLGGRLSAAQAIDALLEEV